MKKIKAKFTGADHYFSEGDDYNLVVSQSKDTGVISVSDGEKVLSYWDVTMMLNDWTDIKSR